MYGKNVTGRDGKKINFMKTYNAKKVVESHDCRHLEGTLHIEITVAVSVLI